MRKLSRGAWLWMIGGGLGVVLAVLVAGLAMLFAMTFDASLTQDDGESQMNLLDYTTLLIGLGVLAALAGLFSFIVALLLVNRLWQVLPPGYGRTTPGLAAGLLAVPIFNLFWTFQALWGWSRDYNQMVRMNNLPLRPAPEGLALAMCLVPLAILPSTCCLSLLGPALLLLAEGLLAMIFFAEAINAANALIDLRSAAND